MAQRAQPASVNPSYTTNPPAVPPQRAGVGTTSNSSSSMGRGASSTATYVAYSAPRTMSPPRPGHEGRAAASLTPNRASVGGTSGAASSTVTAQQRMYRQDHSGRGGAAPQGAHNSSGARANVGAPRRT